MAAIHRQNDPLGTDTMRLTTQDSHRLLDAISRAQEHYISGAPPERLFPRLLDGFLELTGSESGFIGVVIPGSDDVTQVEGRAIADRPAPPIDRSRATGEVFEFDDPGTLLGAVLARRQPVISNQPEGSDQHTGLPAGAGQPVARSFMGLPILDRGEPIGVIAVMNREGGYDEEFASFLKPLLRTYSQLIRALESDREAAALREELSRHRDRLEAEVTDRTGKLADSEALYHTLFDLSPDAIVTFRDGTYVDCNQATLDLFEIRDREELRATGIGGFSPAVQPDGRNSVAAAREYFAACLERGRLWFDWVYRSKSGREFPARVFLQPVTVAGTTIVQAVIRDVSAERKAETELQEHRRYLEAVLEGSPSAIIVTNIDSGEIRFANRSARAMLALEDTGGEPHSDDLWADPAERKRLLAQLEEQGFASGEARLRRLDGTTFPARIDWQYNPGSTDEVLCWSLDISRERHVLEQLHAQERMMQRIVDNLPVALFCKDINDGYRYTLFNRKAEELFGLSSRAVIGYNDFDLLSTDLALRHREEDLKITESAEPLEVSEERIESLAGGTQYVRRTKIAIPDARGKPALIIGMSEDVTERREAEKALHASERRFRELAEHAPVGIFLTDPRGACIFVNQRFQEKTGLSQRESAGSGWFSAVHPDDREVVLNAWREFVDGQSTFALEFRFQLQSGEVVWISSQAVPFKNEAGQAVGFLGTATDITQRKTFEADLRASRDEAQRANQAKSEFLSRMSHELRTPLNAVLGFGQLLQMGDDSFSESQKEGVEQILAGGEHLLQLIDDVLDYSRIDTGHMNLGIQRIDTAEPLARAVSLVQAMAERFEVSLDVPATPLPGVVADPRRLQQVLVNLLSNAIKYNRPGGRVGIRVEPRDEDMTRIAVSDTGPGIRREDQVRLFEPFERIIDPHRVVEGTGIGLSICKRLVQLMGGRIGFDTEFGAGSTFWVDLPAAEVNGGDEEWLFGTLDQLVDPDGLTGLRLLYVEDHLASIRFMSEITRRVPDCELQTATNGTDGFALARSNRPDVILMDLNMPGLSGFQTLELLRGDERTADIPVVALSASATADTIEAVRAAGFDSFLTKPLKLGDLFETLVTVSRAGSDVRSAD